MRDYSTKQREKCRHLQLIVSGLLTRGMPEYDAGHRMHIPIL